MNRAQSGQRRIATPLQLGELIRRRRRARGQTQQELAQRLAISQGRLSSIESDPSSLSVARLIALLGMLDLDLVLRERTGPKSSVEW